MIILNSKSAFRGFMRYHLRHPNTVKMTINIAARNPDESWLTYKFPLTITFV